MTSGTGAAPPPGDLPRRIGNDSFAIYAFAPEADEVYAHARTEADPEMTAFVHELTTEDIPWNRLRFMGEYGGAFALWTDAGYATGDLDWWHEKVGLPMDLLQELEAWGLAWDDDNGTQAHDDWGRALYTRVVREIDPKYTVKLKL